MKKSKIYETAIHSTLLQWYRDSSEKLSNVSDLCEVLEELLTRRRWAAEDEREQKGEES